MPLEADRHDRAERAIRTLIITTVGSAAFAAQGDPEPVRHAELRAAFLDGIGRLLDGMLDT